MTGELNLEADSFVISEQEFCQLSSTFFSLYRSRQFLQRRSPTPQATKRPDPARVLPFVCSFGLRPEMPRLVALTRRLLSLFCLEMWTTGPRKDATPGIRLCSGFGNMRVWQATVAMKKHGEHPTNHTSSNTTTTFSLDLVISNLNIEAIKDTASNHANECKARTFH